VFIVNHPCVGRYHLTIRRSLRKGKVYRYCHAAEYILSLSSVLFVPVRNLHSFGYLHLHSLFYILLGFDSTSFFILHSLLYYLQTRLCRPDLIQIIYRLFFFSIKTTQQIINQQYAVHYNCSCCSRLSWQSKLCPCTSPRQQTYPPR